MLLHNPILAMHHVIDGRKKPEKLAKKPRQRSAIEFLAESALQNAKTKYSNNSCGFLW